MVVANFFSQRQQQPTDTRTFEMNSEDSSVLNFVGTCKEQTNAFVTCIRDTKRRFPFTDAETRKEARKQADRYRAEETRAQQSHCNSYTIERDLARVSITAYKCAGVYLKLEATVDVDNLEKMRNRTWWCRVLLNGTPSYIYSKQGAKRLRLTEVLFNTNDVCFLNNNPLDLRRANVHGALAEPIIKDQSEPATDASAKSAYVMPETDVRTLSATVTADNGPASTSAPPFGTTSATSAAASSSGTQTNSAQPLEPAITGNVEKLPFDFNKFCFPSGPWAPQVCWVAIKQYAAKSPLHARFASEHLSATLRAHYVNFPMPHISDRDMIADIAGMEGHMTQTASDMGAPLAMGKMGQTICKHFLGDAMLQCAYSSASAQAISPAQLWHDDKARARICRTVLSNAARTFSPGSIWSAASLAYYIPSNFPPLVACQLYERYGGGGGGNRDGGSRILDLCSGWAGRLLGFWAAQNTTHYVGVDPNCRLKPRYDAMVSWLRQHSQIANSSDAESPQLPKSVEFIQSGAERTEWADRLLAEKSGSASFDVVFTSPPYFDTEVYDGNQAGQSIVSHGESYEDWRDNFLRPALANGARLLKTGGYMLINVANTKRCPTLEEDTVAIMSEQQMGLQMCASEQLPVPRRPGSGARTDRSEPIFVGRKVASVRLVD